MTTPRDHPESARAPGDDLLGSSWPRRSQIAEVRTLWLALVGERLVDDAGRDLDCWRIEKADSLVVLTILDGELVLPTPTYRPGIDQVTLDFAGGRLTDRAHLEPAAAAIACREFELAEGGSPLSSFELLNEQGWAVDSSSSS